MAALAIAIVAAAPNARADDDNDDRPELQHMKIVERGNVLTVSAKITKLFDSAAFQALSSGFVTTVQLRIWVYAQGSTDVVAYTPVVRSVVYDMWDEIYTVRLADDQKPIKVRSPAEALKLITTIEDLPIADVADIPYGDPSTNVFYVAMRADLNPVDKKTLAEVRRWLSQSNGGGLDRGGTFFGSFVSVFVNPKIAEADRPPLRLLSQPFFRTKP
ncbi:MAG TPA: DUF4390 domain-containing protein [Kofleriaceae bacterium]|nr:DUF4390 domain-containing protein [Kofleriaceae bacterium]